MTEKRKDDRDPRLHDGYKKRWKIVDTTLCLSGATDYGPSSGDMYNCIPRTRFLQLEFIQVRVAVYDTRKHLQSLGNEYLEEYR
jgi:hypothetical protein